MENQPADQFRVPVQSQNFVAANTNPNPAQPANRPKPKPNLKLFLIVIVVLLLITLSTEAYLLGKQSAPASRNATVAQTMNSFGAVNSNLTPTPTLIPTPIASPTSELVGEVVWNIQKTNLTPTEMAIENAFVTYKATPTAEFDSNRRLAVTSVEVSTISANFAITDMELVDANNKVIPTDGFAYYLYKANSLWNIMTGSEGDFCQTIKTFPSDLLTDNLKAYLGGCFPK